MLSSDGSDLRDQSRWFTNSWYESGTCYLLTGVVASDENESIIKIADCLAQIVKSVYSVNAPLLTCLPVAND
jgi:hypothetical protein